MPDGKALVQTLDFFTPIVDDPYKFGQIAAANALSDVYAMGGVPWCAMNIVCFPSKTLDIGILAEILRGGADKLDEAGAALAGGHSVEDEEIKFGLSVTGLVNPDSFATNTGLVPGDVLLVTKALGTGVLATAIKADVAGAAELEQLLYQSASRLNKAPGEAISRFKLKAATDITGFGLGGHLLEMLEASRCSAVLHAEALHFLPHATELADDGFVPAGSYANGTYRECLFAVDDDVPRQALDMIFDAQTSGGMILAVPPSQVGDVFAFLKDKGEIVCVAGEVLPSAAASKVLHIRR